MADLAREAGVTPAAVSLALKNHPRISETRRKEIQALAQRMGYRPNAMATSLALHRHRSRERPVQAALAWINSYPDPRKLRAWPDAELCWRGASKAAEKLGYRLEEFAVNEKQPLQRLERIFLARNIRGIIIAPLPADQSELDWMSCDWSKFSVVRLGRRDDPPRFHFATSAQVANTMLSFEKMRERGYERIGFAGVLGRSKTFGAGFLWAQLQPVDCSTLPPFLFSGKAPEVTEQRRFEAWLEETKPDAILTDRSALPQMLKRAGCRVPEDIGLAATTVQDIPVSAGINQNSEELGRVATLLVVSLLHDNDQGIPSIQREILVHGTWVDGSSLPVRK